MFQHYCITSKKKVRRPIRTTRRYSSIDRHTCLLRPIVDRVCTIEQRVDRRRKALERVSADTYDAHLRATYEICYPLRIAQPVVKIQDFIMKRDRHQTCMISASREKQATDLRFFRLTREPQPTDAQYVSCTHRKDALHPRLYVRNVTDRCRCRLLNGH